ncbi:HD domain-containing protein [Spirillospora sp. NPDC047279]|uniref:HD domain-containing protein n=1 Tax=Spirillospora sp. NPDC047279 TaxID=3155478 RepID=UPI003405B041
MNGASFTAGLPATITRTDRERIRRAYEFAARWHEGQRRRSGDPYITHPVAVAELAAGSGQDATMICAALLHDVLEGTGCERAELRAEFGEEVSSLVSGLADLPSANERVLTLKVLDRLHNIRTIEYVDARKQRSKCEDTLEVTAPLAGRLGLRTVAEELERLASAHLGSLARSPGLSSRALTCGAVLLPGAARSRFLEEWLGELDTLPTSGDRARFAWRVLLSVPRLAFTLRGAAWNVGLRWILRSNVRTWIPLLTLLGWIIAETARDNPVDAVVVLITVPPVMNAGVRWLRDKLTE